MKKLKMLLAGICACATAACSSSTAEKYAAEKPALDIRQYLNGPLEAWGMILNRSGEQDLRFYVKMTGSWKGNTGTLEEAFEYSDGRKDKRIWTITFSDNHNFTATAHDVIGNAVGTQYGNAVNMRYTLAVPYKGSTIHLKLDDWLYLMDDKTLINRTDMKKLGFKVGELIVVFKKP